MIAQTYLNGFLQHARESDDPAVMLALQNFCLDNLKKSIETAAANKKAVDQLRDINEFWFFAAIISVVMQEIQFKIDRAFYLNDAIERKEILDKLSEEAQNRLEKINDQYEQYIAGQLLIQQRLNQANIDNILKQRANAIEDIRQLATEISVLKTNLQSVNQTISLDVNKMIADVSVDSYEFKIANQTISVSQDEIATEMIDEFGEDLQNGTIRLNNLEDRVFNRFKNIHDRKISEKGLDPIEHAEQSESFARDSTNTWVTKFKAHENYIKVEENIAIRESIKQEIENKVEKQVNLQQEINEFNGLLREAGYVEQIVEDIAQNREELTEDMFDPEISEEIDDEDNAIDPFADDDEPEQDMQNNNRPDDDRDDDYQPPAIPPDEPGPAPSDNPPDYNINQNNQGFPAPSAPSLEDLQPPRPSAPSIEENPPPQDKFEAPNTPPPDNSVPIGPPPQYPGDKPASVSEIGQKSDKAESKAPLENIARQENIKPTDAQIKNEQGSPSAALSSRAQIYGDPSPAKVEQANPALPPSSPSTPEKPKLSTTASLKELFAKEEAKNPKKVPSTKPIQSESNNADENKLAKPAAQPIASTKTEIKSEKIPDDKKPDEEPENAPSPKPGRR